MNDVYKMLILLLLALVFISGKGPKESDSLIREIVAYKNDDIHRITYYYDESGNITIQNKYRMINDFANPVSRTEWIYSNGKCIAQADYMIIEGDWKLFHKILIDYQGDRKESETYIHIDNRVEDIYKTLVYEYINDNIKTISTFDGLKNESKLSKQLKSDYNSKNQLIKQNMRFFLDENELHKVFEYKYNTQSLVDSLIVSIIENESPSSQLLSIFFYNSEQNKLIKQIQKKWDTSNSAWRNLTKIEYEYNSDLSMKKEFYYHFSNVFWTSNFKYEYIYDSDGLLLKKIMYQPIYERWRKVNTITYSKIEQDKPSVMDSKYDFWGGETGTYVNSFIPFYFNDEMTIMQADRLELYYILQTNDITTMYEGETGKVNIYPNPSNGVFYISTDKYKIKSWNVYNMDGKIVKSKYNNSHTGVVDLSQLNDGIYLFKAQTVENKDLMQKVVIQRSK